MRAQILVVSLAALACSLATAQAQAQSCSLHLVNTAPLSMHNGALTVPASVNGIEMPFQIDTAALASQMNKEAVATVFKLSNENSDPASVSGGAILTRGAGSLPNAVNPDTATNIFDARGNAFRGTTNVKDFVMGAMQGTQTFTITDFPAPGTGGILNAGYFRRFDMDLNLVGGKFNMFATDHCKDKVLYWRAPVMASLPIAYQDNRIKVRVSIDGKEMDAIIDTGAPASLMRTDIAARLFSITPDTPGAAPVEPGSANYAYTFKTLSLGGVSIDNPRLQLTRSIVIRGANSTPQTGSRLRSSTGSSDIPPLVIGLDMLKLLHVYIAFNDRMMYVTQGQELPPNAAGALPMVVVAPFRP